MMIGVEVPMKRKTAAKVILIGFIVIIFTALVTRLMYQSYLKKPVSTTSKDIEFRINKGENSSMIIDKMAENGLITNRLFARIYLKNHGIDRSLRFGYYKFNTSMTPVEIFKILLSGQIDPDIINVSIPEGFTIKQIANKLKEKGIISSTEAFINEAQNGKFNYEFLEYIPKSRPSRLEGYLYPDTYELKKGMSSHVIIDKMLDRFNSVIITLQNSGLKTKDIDKIIIMASIVEGEAKLDSERPIIAAVFYNRLKINKKLESCATVEYALGVHKPVLYYKDIAVNSLYNTYKYAGLPIGPINNPGLKSIGAAIYPEQVDYIYFVSKGDGSHYFTKNYDDFLKYKKSLKN